MLQKPRSGSLTRDREIRSVLISKLQAKYPSAEEDLILEEFGCNTARIDVAVVNGALHGFEIKSDCDSISRLDNQLMAYEGVFDYITLVAGRKLFDTVKAMVPETCGLILADKRKGEVVLREKRKARKNPAQRNYDLARMMWRDEALACLRVRGHRAATSRHSAEQIWRATATSLEIAALADEVRLAIKRRGGSGFAKRSERGGDLCTTGSIALLDHYSENLAWLLSMQSGYRPH